MTRIVIIKAIVTSVYTCLVRKSIQLKIGKKNNKDITKYRYLARFSIIRATILMSYTPRIALTGLIRKVFYIIRYNKIYIVFWENFLGGK